MDSKKTTSLLVTSILVVITAMITALMLHEFSHYVVAKFINVNANYHSISVKLPPITDFSKTFLIAATGPTFSLVLGIIFFFSYFQIKSKSLLTYFILWFSLINLAVFFGYLILAPFLNGGDTGIVMNYFNVPTIIRYLLALMAYLFFFLIFPKMAYEFTRYTTNKNQTIDPSKEIIIYPLVLSVIVILALSFPFDQWIALIPVFCIPLSFIGIARKYKKIYAQTPESDKVILTKNYTLIVVCVFTAVLFLIFK